MQSNFLIKCQRSAFDNQLGVARKHLESIRSLHRWEEDDIWIDPFSDADAPPEVAAQGIELMCQPLLQLLREKNPTDLGLTDIDQTKAQSLVAELTDSFKATIENACLSGRRVDSALQALRDNDLLGANRTLRRGLTDPDRESRVACADLLLRMSVVSRPILDAVEKIFSDKQEDIR